MLHSDKGSSSKLYSTGCKKLSVMERELSRWAGKAEGSELWNSEPDKQTP